MARLSVDNIAEIFIFRVLDPPPGVGRAVSGRSARVAKGDGL